MPEITITVSTETVMTVTMTLIISATAYTAGYIRGSDDSPHAFEGFLFVVALWFVWLIFLMVIQS